MTMALRPVLRASRLTLCSRCYATTTSTTPPMLLKIRRDMKTAMQAKDTNRLSVLRALMSQTLNASKTSSPITTDMQMLALLRKSSAAARAAEAEFRDAGRADLAEKESLQGAIIEEYAGSVQTMGEGDIRSVVSEVVAQMKVEAEGKELKMGEVLKKVFAPGALGDKPAEKGEVAKIVKEIMAA